MISDDKMISVVFEGWRNYHEQLVAAIAPLTDEQLLLGTTDSLRTVRAIVTHMIGARARWFSIDLKVGGEEFQKLGRWDAKDAPPRSTEELVYGLQATWKGMQEAIERWTAEDWAKSWPGESDNEPEFITPQWIIWHLIEHDLHHGGEISITLGANGVKGIDL